MMDATSKIPGAGGRRGFQDHAYMDARGQLYGKPRSYCGCTPPNPTPAPHDPAIIAQDLADAAEHLDAIAHRMFALGDDTGESETADLDALAVGIGRAACELRMRQHGKDGAPCHD